jgi:hypothetical protein
MVDITYCTQHNCVIYSGHLLDLIHFKSDTIYKCGLFLHIYYTYFIVHYIMHTNKNNQFQ